MFYIMLSPDLALTVYQGAFDTLGSNIYSVEEDLYQVWKT
jgi:hypothetical protein